MLECSYLHSYKHSDFLRFPRHIEEVYSPTGSGSGLVISWEQETGIQLASGDVRFIRVWDTQREMRMQVGVTLLV